MNVLLADDDALVRLMLSRVLQRAGATSVTEVDNGLDAIEHLENGHYDLLVLDLVMPSMDGFEVLQMVRASSNHRALPVVIVSSVRDERRIVAAIELGICDYLSKPLRPERLTARIVRALQAAAAAGLDGGRRMASCLEPGKPLMIVDANGDFRHFFGSVMGARNPVAEVPSGVQALKLCLDSPPSALFVGPDIGTLSPEALVRKLRGSARGQRTTVVGAWPKSMLEAARDSGIFDEVIARTFVPKALVQQLNEVFARDVADTLQATLRALEPKVQSAAQQVFGMMLGTELASASGPLPEAPMVVSSVEIVRDIGDHLDLRVLVPVANAREFAARLLLVDDPTDEDARSAIGEVSNVIGGRLQKSLNELGTAATCGTPRARLSGAPTSLAAPSPMRLVQCFAAESGEVLLGVELGGEGVAELIPDETTPREAAQSGGAAA
ncbi:MAG: response regulator [Acidobacteriota bacterium]|nr:response regulator [Acidobacteriota bacterium]